MKKIRVVVLALSLLTLVVTGCGSSKTSPQTAKIEDAKLVESDWDEIVKSAKGETVTFYGWGGDDKINKWVDNVVGKTMKEKYNITLKRVPMDIGEIINKLVSERKSNMETGVIDVIWMNGENFKTSKDNDLLFGSFTHVLPNYINYVDEQLPEMAYDFGVSVDNMEAPYGKAQFVLIGDTDKVPNLPKDTNELLQWAKENPGKLTYPAPPDFTGSAFVRNVIYNFIQPEMIMDADLTKEELREIIKPAMDYLVELKPYLWKKGTTYPATESQISNMFSDGEVYFTMNYTANGVVNMVRQGVFPETAQTFILGEGTPSNTNFLTIPFHSPTKAAAMVVINEILSPEMQASKADFENWGDMTVLSYEKMSEEEKALFEQDDQVKGLVSPEELQEKARPEPPAGLVPLIEEIWIEDVLNR